MKKWLKWLIPGESTEVDLVEKKVEKILPQKVKKEVKSHFLLYILGLLLVLVLAGYFAFTYAKDVKDTKKSQDLIQQQVNLQKEQLALQAKQLEDAKKNTTAPATITAPTTNISPTTNNSNLMSCKINGIDYGKVTKSRCDQLLKEAGDKNKACYISRQTATDVENASYTQTMNATGNEYLQAWAIAQQACANGSAEADFGMDCNTLLAHTTQAYNDKKAVIDANHKKKLADINASCND